MQRVSDPCFFHLPASQLLSQFFGLGVFDSCVCIYIYMKNTVLPGPLHLANYSGLSQRHPITVVCKGNSPSWPYLRTWNLQSLSSVLNRVLACSCLGSEENSSKFVEIKAYPLTLFTRTRKMPQRGHHCDNNRDPHLQP